MNAALKDDDIAFKREARRKRILENAKNRLEKIAGRKENDESLDKDRIHEAEIPESRNHIVYPDPEDERDVYVRPTPIQMSTQMPPASAFFAGGNTTNPFDNQQFLDMLNSLNSRSSDSSQPFGGDMNDLAAFTQFASFAGPGGDANPFLAGMPNNNGSAKPPESHFNKFLKSKIHIGLLSIFTYLLIMMAPFSCNVFFIFLLWEITEIFILRQHETNPNGLINVLFMLAGISPTKINVVVKWIQLINKVLRDVAIFLFFFVLSHIGYIYACGKGNLVSLVSNADQSHTIESTIDEDHIVFDERFDL